MIRLTVLALVFVPYMHCSADTTPVNDMIDRVVGVGASESFKLSIIDTVPSWCAEVAAFNLNECVRVSSGADVPVVIEATSISSLTYGVGMYLRGECGASLTWAATGGVAIPAKCLSKLPSPTETRVYSRSLKFTYYQNVVDSSYSFVWWDWKKWEQEIDYMALSGINLALMYTGQEAVLDELYSSFKVNLSNATGNNDFFNGPAFLSWSRGQGMAGVGGRDTFANGSTGALPAWWLNQQAELGINQSTRMRSLGIKTILRGFEGNVPGQLKALYPNANISQVSATNWLLDALDPLFNQLSDKYMELLIAKFGTDHYYQADGFFNNKRGPWVSDQSIFRSELPQCDYSNALNNTYLADCTDQTKCSKFNSLAQAEAACDKDYACGGVTYQYDSYQPRASNTATTSPPGKPSTSWAITNLKLCRGPPPPPPPPPPPNTDAAAHSAAAFAGLTRTDPEAIWVYQTWIWRGFSTTSDLEYLTGWLSAIPHGRGLMLDQTAEWTPIWKKFNNWVFESHDFIWCTMSTMGGNLGMYGNLETLNVEPFAAKNITGSSLMGVGIDPEGINTNPAYYQFMFDSAWRSTLVNTSDWLEDWATQRCGGNDPSSAIEAWKLLLKTVYANDSHQSYEHHMGYCPTWMPEGSGWDRQHASEQAAWYNVSDLHKAWGLLIEAATSGGCNASSPAFIFDLVDVGREYLSVAPCIARADALVHATSSSAVSVAIESMTSLMNDLDTLLATSDGFLLGRWIKQARDLAVESGAPDDADFLEWNARAQVTSWYPSTSCDGSASSLDGLWDYGNKAWSGLVANYYAKRYEIYAQHKLNIMGKSRFDASSYAGDMMKLACEFAQNRSTFPASAVGNAVDIASALWKKYQ